jgi:hypothetical protein
MTAEEATGALGALGGRAEQAHAKLEASGDEDDPRWVELGDALGRMYVLCVCNESIARTRDCDEIMAAMDESFDLSE